MGNRAILDRNCCSGLGKNDCHLAAIKAGSMVGRLAGVESSLTRLAGVGVAALRVNNIIFTMGQSSSKTRDDPEAGPLAVSGTGRVVAPPDKATVRNRAGATALLHPAGRGTNARR